jgi:hypothetical protein
MSDPSVFIVDSSTPEAAAPSLGYWERKCDACHKAWGPTRCSDSACSSTEFTDTYHKPKPILSGLAALVLPKPKPKPRADAATVSALRGLQGTAMGMLAELHALEAQLRAAVIADVQELAVAQAVVHQALSIEGDASWERVAGLSLALRAFAAALSRAIEHTEETP